MPLSAPHRDEALADADHTRALTNDPRHEPRQSAPMERLRH
jgi:hypothetical protein